MTKSAAVCRRLAVLPLLALALSSRAEVKLNPLFTDHCVLQRGMAVPVWGTAAPGEEVVVTFGRQAKKTKAADDGRWLVRLDKLSASDEPRTLAAGGARATDVLVGEVWLCSGQSNMQWPLCNTSNSAAALAAADDPGLRLFYVPRVAADEPVLAVGTNWQVAAPASASNFSAVAYYFGRDLRAALKVPVGLVQSAWGGTPAEAWTPRGVLESNSALKAIVTQYETSERVYDEAKAREKLARELATWSNAVAKAKADGAPAPRKPMLEPRPSTTPRRPACLYNGLIRPLVPFAMRGAIWYQGEANSGRAEEYTTLLPAMIDAWRADFGVRPFPFLQVQIAPQVHMVPEIREAQWRIARAHPDTYVAVTADVGEEENIHPRDKEPVGARLARIARAKVYGERLECSGPTLAKSRVQGAEVVLDFDHAKGGLVSRAERPSLFTLAPAGSTNFVPAEARIEGPRIRVSAAGIEHPGAVRYAWRNWFQGELFNRDGLPAPPFRTDEPEKSR